MVKVYHSIPYMSTIFLHSDIFFDFSSHFLPFYSYPHNFKNVDKPFLSCYNFYSSFMMSYKII